MGHHTVYDNQAPSERCVLAGLDLKDSPWDLEESLYELARLAESAGAVVTGRDRAVQSSTQLLALVPGLTGQYLRRAFLSRSIDR